MKESLYKFFNKRSTFVTATVISVLFFAANIITKFILAFSDAALFTEEASSLSASMFNLAISDIFLVICIIAFATAFIKHNKNVQKMLLGAILFWYVIDQTSYVLSQVVTGEMQQIQGAFGMILQFMILILFIILFINSLVINSDKSNKPSGIYLNQVIIILLVFITLVKLIYGVELYAGNVVELLENIFWQGGYIFFLFMIMSFETEIDFYRALRAKKQ